MCTVKLLALGSGTNSTRRPLSRRYSVTPSTEATFCAFPCARADKAGEDRTEGDPPSPSHSDRHQSREQALVPERHAWDTVLQQQFRRPDRGEHRRRYVAQRAHEKRRQLHALGQQQERGALVESEQRHGCDDEPETHCALVFERLSNKRPKQIPTAAASARPSLSGSPFASTAVAPAESAAASIGWPRRKGIVMAMKASGAANSSFQAAGRCAPATMPVAT